MKLQLLLKIKNNSINREEVYIDGINIVYLKNAYSNEIYS